MPGILPGSVRGHRRCREQAQSANDQRFAEAWGRLRFGLARRLVPALPLLSRMDAAPVFRSRPRCRPSGAPIRCSGSTGCSHRPPATDETRRRLRLPTENTMISDGTTAPTGLRPSSKAQNHHPQQNGARATDRPTPACGSRARTSPDPCGSLRSHHRHRLIGARDCGRAQCLPTPPLLPWPRIPPKHNGQTPARWLKRYHTSATQER